MIERAERRRTEGQGGIHRIRRRNCMIGTLVSAGRDGIWTRERWAVG